MPFSVHRITGLVYGQDRQDVAFLDCAEDARIDAEGAFNDLDDKRELEMRNKFDYWKRGGHNAQWFHGFNEIGYRECFVFKRKQAGTYYRFYGFLIHPRPLSDARYRLCILVSHAQKNQANTDPSELNFVNEIRGRVEVIAAVKREFPERPGGSNATLHQRRR
jgi:hypothetical protein